MKQKIIQFINAQFDSKLYSECGVYPKSICINDRCDAFMVDDGAQDLLVARAGVGFIGETISTKKGEWVIARRCHENVGGLRRYFPFTAPISVLKFPRSVGVGDRLDIATPGHIRVFEQYDAYPVFAQQSIRELNLTNRTFEDVLDCVSWVVFREKYTRGFGADGDHLKTAEDIGRAISCGYTMITLDCSDHIRNDVLKMTNDQCVAAYVTNVELERKYLGKTFSVGDVTIQFTPDEFRRMCLIYNEAIDFAVSIYQQFFVGREELLDLELSIDEAAAPTSPAQHYYIASELINRGVQPATIAPRFYGEFQKGIDYIGDLARFEKEFTQHAAIAKHFGYKISVHSGSDKFSIFGLVGKHTGGNFHLKTSGTNWLEAMLLIAKYTPSLYREIHQYALDYAFTEARKYYHVTTNLNNIPALHTVLDKQLPMLFQNNDVRQLIHITYGLILNEKNADGTYRFRTRLYSVWKLHAKEYAQNLERHIGKHLALLYGGFKEEKQ